jgi:AcrR family transcriptional regulator
MARRPKTDTLAGHGDEEPSRRRQVRIEPEARHREFVRKAVGLFSEVGFEAGTRELAQRLGVTQPLLYRYFPSKDDLIEAVYKEIYVDRWKPSWRETILDAGRPLRERLQAFYEDYADTIFTPEWLRIYLFAGLRGVAINRRYVANVETSILTPIAIELRREIGLSTDAPIRPEELELVWTLHGGIFYYGVRTIVYGFDCPIGRSQMIANALDAFLEGAPSVVRRAAETAIEPVSAPSSRRRSSGSRR